MSTGRNQATQAPSGGPGEEGIYIGMRPPLNDRAVRTEPTTDQVTYAHRCYTLRFPSKPLRLVRPIDALLSTMRLTNSTNMLSRRLFPFDYDLGVYAIHCLVFQIIPIAFCSLHVEIFLFSSLARDRPCALGCGVTFLSPTDSAFHSLPTSLPTSDTCIPFMSPDVTLSCKKKAYPLVGCLTNRSSWMCG